MKRSPNTRQLEERLAQWRKETQLQDRFYESRGAHFSVLFEGPADEALARSIVERLEAAYWRVGMALTASSPKAITVVLYTTEQFRDVTRMPEWTVAYDGRIHVPVRGAFEQVDRLDRVSHEFVHAVVAMLERTQRADMAQRGIGPDVEPGHGRAPTGARARQRPATTAGAARRLLQDVGAEASVAYALSARAVQRMIDLRGPRGGAAAAGPGARGDFAAAFQQRISMRVRGFSVDGRAPVAARRLSPSHAAVASAPAVPKTGACHTRDAGESLPCRR